MTYFKEKCAVFSDLQARANRPAQYDGGSEKPTKGKIKVKGHEITTMNEKHLAKLRQSHVGFIFQSYNLLASLTAVENVSLPLMFRNVPKTKREKEAMHMLKAVGLKKYILHKPTQMSGGQQQRVGIARALWDHQPLYLLMSQQGT